MGKAVWTRIATTCKQAASGRSRTAGRLGSGLCDDREAGPGRWGGAHMHSADLPHVQRTQTTLYRNFPPIKKPTGRLQSDTTFSS